MSMRLSLLSPLLLLAGCATPPNAGEPASVCKADAAQTLVGRPATDANLEAVRKATGADILRSLKPGEAATLDYRVERVNVLQDATGNIERITCG